MERVKSLRTIKWILPLVVAVFGMAIAFAFTGKEKENVVTTTFYYHGPTPASALDMDTPSNYSTQPDPNVQCGGSGALCSIVAPSAGGTPEQPVIDEENPVSDDPEAYFAEFRAE